MNQAANQILSYPILLAIILLLCSSHSYSQDTLKKSLPALLYQTDSLLSKDDSAFFYSLYGARKRIIQQQWAQVNQQDEILKSSKNAVHQTLPHASPLLHVSGGYSSYAANYRSVIDTPYAEKNILQHDLVGRINFTAGGSLPLQLSYLVRNSNSAIFRDIYDAQLSLDPAGLRKMLNDQINNRFQNLAGMYEDSLKEKRLKLQQEDLNLTREWLQNPLQNQRMLEAREVLAVPGITNLPENSPQQNELREKMLRKEAARLLKLYSTVDSLYLLSFAHLDSAKKQYELVQSKANRLRSLGSKGFGSYRDYMNWSRGEDGQSSPETSLPKKYTRLLAIRSLSLGRTPVNYSELTAKNISVRGLNVEYNSWYYAAFSAGLVDAQFRDLDVSGIHNRQYLVMARAGIGNIENTSLILSAFRGRKQLFTATSNQAGITTIDVTGFSLQSTYKIGHHASLTSEAAQSLSPDFQSGDLSRKTRFSLSDKSNKAFAIKLSAYYPRAGTRMEGSYKYTGANYQSFSSFQTNSSLVNWYLRGEQQLFRKMIRVSASLRTNDFSNPYIVQQYKSNTVFKSLNVSFRKPKWPVLSVGYQPMTQLTVVENYITENRFQTLNINAYHYYSVGSVKAASTVMFNKFYNHLSDTSFIYFNAASVYFGQNIFLGSVTAGLAVSDTRNSEYQSQVFDESMQMPLSGSSSLLLGVKINNFNSSEVRVGTYCTTSLRIFKNDILYFSYERGFLPGYGKQLIRNDMATVQFTKFFGSGNTFN